MRFLEVTNHLGHCYSDNRTLLNLDLNGLNAVDFVASIELPNWDEMWNVTLPQCKPSPHSKA